MYNEDFVSFEQAKRLKALVFNEPVFFRYDKNGKFEQNKWAIDEAGYVSADELCYDCNNFEFYCSAPTLSQACKWLREKHNIHIQIESVVGKRWTYCLVDTECLQDISGEYISRIPERDCYPVIDTYEQAQSAAIDIALGLLEN